MGWRWFKRIPIVPGLRLNLSKRGATVSVGPRGFTTTFGRRGRRTTFSVPGTGLSYTMRDGGNTPRPSARCPSCGSAVSAAAKFCATCGAPLVEDEG